MCQTAKGRSTYEMLCNRQGENFFYLKLAACGTLVC
jgi:hypothetical protein